ncbi:MAG: acyl-CoA dehydrogenase [Pseudohongiellaceae bacterium]
MDFSFTEEHLMLKDSVQKFIKRSYDFETRGKIIASAKGFSEKNWNTFAELGWLSVPFSEEDGGFGGRVVDLLVLMQEFGRAMIVEPFVATAIFSGGLLSRLGSREQKQQFIPAVIEGKLQLACAFAESAARYNPASVETTATAEGDGYLLNGNKIAVLNGAAADYVLVTARTGGNSRDRKGISLFLVPATASGLKKRAYTNIDGQQAAEISLNSVKVSATDRLGDEGEVITELEAVIDEVSVALCAEAVGAMEVLLQKTVEYSKTRNQFGTAIGTFQALQHRMVDMFVECELAKSIVMMAAMKLDSSDQECRSQAVSAAKSRVGLAMRRVGQEAVQLHGGIGVTDELDVGHLFKRITAIEQEFGTTDFHTARFSGG